MARRRRGERGRWVGPVVDYPGTPGGPRTDGGAARGVGYPGYCDPRGPRRIARRPAPGWGKGIAGRFVISAGSGVRFRQDASS